MVMDVYQYGVLLLTEKKLVSGHQLIAGVSFIPYGRAPVIFEVSSDDHVNVFSEVLDVNDIGDDIDLYIYKDYSLKKFKINSIS